jgi:hypothetical protein
MQSFTASQANVLVADVLNRSDGSPITSGIVNGYLVARSGTNSGKWFRASDSTWTASESTVGTMTHESDGHWILSVESAAWITGTRYSFYAKDSDNLHIPYTEEIVEISTPTLLQVEATIDT